ncbi:NAD(P)-binding protein [Pleurotus eryngii]|uniref:NAD(P)-binding protein n=1 Tax=Pleurotus eryngii TaxID=5323 RepID=A0A9P6A973_PLEER|nr:NAD(P)-binding protein [Pleurotus eryngii]
MTTPTMQKAWIIERMGHPSKTLKLKSDWPVPSEIPKDHVLVKIQAAALNPVGWKLMLVAPNFVAKRPLPAEYDFAGVIEKKNGTKFEVGNPVFGSIHVPIAMKTRQGTLAEYALVPDICVTERPSNIDAIHASGLTLAGLTAWQSLFEYAHLKAGQTVFVYGASTAVGLFAIQIAKARGIKVVASASGRNEELVKKTGADEFIDYTKEPIHKYLTSHPPSPKFHAIIDAYGLSDPSLYAHSAAYMAPGGVFVTTTPGPHDISFKEIGNLFKTIAAVTWPSWLGGVPRKFKFVSLKANKANLEAFRDLVAEGKIVGIVDSVYGMQDVLKAYERIMSSRATGKVVVKVEGST